MCHEENNVAYRFSFDLRADYFLDMTFAENWLSRLFRNQCEDLCLWPLHCFSSLCTEGIIVDGGEVRRIPRP